MVTSDAIITAPPTVTAATTPPPTVVPRPCRWTIPCPQPRCTGFIQSGKGNSSWKRGDFADGTGPITAGCSDCHQEVVIERPF